jgi:hypothetical protein
MDPHMNDRFAGVLFEQGELGQTCTGKNGDAKRPKQKIPATFRSRGFSSNGRQRYFSTISVNG